MPDEPDQWTRAKAALALNYINWALFGSQGLRVGWSVLIFFIFFSRLQLRCSESCGNALSPDGEVRFLSHHGPDFGADSPAGHGGSSGDRGAIEHRAILDYNLTGPRRISHFLAGLAAGSWRSRRLSARFLGRLAAFWRLGSRAASGFFNSPRCGQWSSCWWACVEEGIFRCYLQFTLTRGINFWWALGIVGCVCL